jgi:hypothetical protein
MPLANKKLIILVFISVLISFSGSLLSKNSKEDMKAMERQAITYQPDLRNEEIVEVILEVSSPQYKEPESIRIFPIDKRSKAFVVSSGLIVTGGLRRPGQDMSPNVVRKPEDKKISIEQYQSLINMFKANTLWFASKPKELSSSGLRTKISIKTQNENVRPANVQNVIAVEASYFEPQRESKEFQAIFQKICGLFGQDITPANYD